MICGGNRTCIYCFGLVLLAVPGAAAVSGASWNGRLSDASGKPVADAILLLHPAAGGRDYTTTATGKFAFTDIAGGSYEVSLQTGDKEWKAGPLVSKTLRRSVSSSAVLGGRFGTAGVILQTLPQDPWNPSAEKGLSTFDVSHAFSASVIQLLPLGRAGFLRPLGRTLTEVGKFSISRL
jgi:hypothetical protein